LGRRCAAVSEQAQQLEPLSIALRVAAANFNYYAKRFGESTKVIELAGPA
jgi:hypothetical protein